MVAPLLGILGAGALFGAVAPRIVNYRDNVLAQGAARRNEAALEGVDQNDIGATTNALFGAGLLSPDQFLARRMGLAEFDSMASYRAGQLGLQRDQLALDRERFGLDLRRFDFARQQDLMGMIETPTMQVDLGYAAQAVGQLESGNRYDRLGPMLKEGSYAGDRAYGRYQVMGRNIPVWTQEVLGQALTPDEFLANPGAQDAVFAAKFGENAAKYGLEDAASIWHSGDRLSAAAERGANDKVTGLATVDYVRRVRGTYGSVAGQAQQMRDAELASIDAGVPGQAGIATTDAILGGLDQLSRLPGGGRLDTDTGAIMDDLAQNAFELRMQWQKTVYGDAEPPPRVIEEIDDLFRDPNAWTANRERTARQVRVMRAEMVKAQQYDQLRAAAGRGVPGAMQQLREFGGRELTRTERQGILRGEEGATGRALPEGLAPGRAPSGQAEPPPDASRASPGRGGRK